jgi:hypothetical protein
LRGNARTGKRGSTPMFTGLDVIKKAKKRGKKREFGRGECCRISTFGKGIIAEMCCITP